MELFTYDPKRKIELPVYIEDKDIFSQEGHMMFRLILIEKGGGIASINENNFGA